MNLFLYQLQGELWKLFARKRTHLGFAVFLAVEILILILWQLPRGQQWMRRAIEQSGGAFDDYFSGLTVAFIMLSATIFLLGGLFLALVGGDLVAKEVEDGTMRMTLCRPVSRTRILALKYLCCLFYTFLLVHFIGLSAIAAASVFRGNGGLFIAVPQDRLLVFYDFSHGLARYLAALPFLSLSLLSIATFSFMLSCWNIKPATATISALTVFFVDWIFHLLPYFESYRQWMMTAHLNTWLNVFRSPIPWLHMIEDYAYLFGLNATFLLIGLAVFSSRDFKS